MPAVGKAFMSADLAGYFGCVPGGLLDEIGRGYTDLCAALVAIGLSAEELQVWKEVDGIFTADPRKVPTARLLSTITPAEAAELTFYGSEVLVISSANLCPLSTPCYCCLLGPRTSWLIMTIVMRQFRSSTHSLWSRLSRPACPSE
jgi:hypothetical protein